MPSDSIERITFEVSEHDSVSALLCVPASARACFVFAHGAGAGMDHAFMASVSQELAQHAVATLRYQFPYMERGSKRPDVPKIAHAAVRAAVGEAARRVPDLHLFAGGKSFGGRMTSQAQAESALVGVRGLVFIGFPLHPAGKPSIGRAAHLLDVACPMLFLQGTRDELADLTLLRQALAPLNDRATLEVFDDADHSFHVRARSGQTDVQVRAALVSAMVNWIGAAAP
jgi:predicted alpha/beta-hydrolase family hydrolase